MRSEAQKKAQKKYDKKSINFAISYKQHETAEGERVKKYLSDTGQSANAYIKSLIKADLDSKGILLLWLYDCFC